MLGEVFGKQPAGKRLDAIKDSPNYRDGSFQNISRTPVMAEDSSFWKTLLAYFNKPASTTPPRPLPFVKTDLKALPSTAPTLVWFGHSTYLLRIDNTHILVDPVFSKNAAPFSFMVKAYPGADQYSIDDLPPIDILLQTHDHYDHLDYASVKALLPSVKKVITTLGTGAHFEYWGYDPAIITELDWWQTTSLGNGMQLTATPARHFSGRGIARGKTLWAGFVLQLPQHTIYLGGDSGYDTHFARIGETYGPFHLAILECGQYNRNWPHIHMMPEETVQAALDLRATCLLPVHWAKFTLSLHPWNEPIKRVVKEAAARHLTLATPKIGEAFSIGGAYPAEEWWHL
ncbi:MAG TPA: MBL fold metallo-hydrolase [Chitinophagaceae bacterium]|nr:MBL fold metallo-hydrolase [Chitinophagaceae bacterium]